MTNGYYVTCPKCGAQIEDFSLSNEWFCECGESREIEYEEEEE